MSRMNRWVRRLSGAEPPLAGTARGASREDLARTTRTMVRTLAFGLEVRDTELDIVDHCTLVAEIAARIGRLLRISEAEAYILDTAARLHEIGMFAVPPALLKRAAPLSPEELALVRSQARLSAEIASTMHHPRVVELIEHQYDDYAELTEKLEEPSLLLAGILRVADLIAAVTRPRPYQVPLPGDRRAELLRSGAGTRFHPAAVRCALQVPIEA
jgi:response regulator RpfG family c-di-GMP phosphodiesterase